MKVMELVAGLGCDGTWVLLAQFGSFLSLCAGPAGS